MEEVSLRFASARGRCEVEFAAACLCNPGLGIIVAGSLGITAEHFAIHQDARIIFCACLVAHQHGDEVVCRIAQCALEAESLLYGDPAYLRSLLARYKFTASLFHSYFLRVCGRRLLTMHVAERDALEHLSYARRILAKGAA